MSEPATSTTKPTRVRVEAPAKLNLLLRVLGKEASGYHAIETLFVKLALHDTVEVDTSVAQRTLTCAGPLMPAAGLGDPQQNLAYRAAELFAERAGWATGFAINIEKNIPVGGGLGGGSADAAAVLRALNLMAPEPLSSQELLQLAGALGSDVPFLVSDALLAWGWGRGDRMLVLPALPQMQVQLIAFEEGVSTSAAYQALGVTATTQAGAAAYAFGSFASWERVAAASVNDFERAVPAFHAGVARWLPRLRAEASRLQEQGAAAMALMSGSGATCFLVHAPDALPELPDAQPDERIIQTSTASAIVPPERML